MLHRKTSVRLSLQPKHFYTYMSATTYTGSDGLMDEQRQADSARSNESAKPPPRFRRIIIVGGALLLVALVIGFVPHWRQRQTAAADTKQLAVSTVAVVSPTSNTPASGLTLPAEVKPWLDASIFAQASGYLKTRLVDIGAHVEPGQLLAEIDTPDLNQQLEQARAQI